ncbi:hypothetical protein PoB_001561800 [Plakobranchus ocellatus]|uniref:Uncharacterized protein n=1 Tax=Plakobranchus ocellatus TaxID=259542 RepID=A0AAV3Z3E0_9GAST|nr:hypothetical protein PoB_001561800 [Plakobranchus ocellatus]
MNPLRFAYLEKKRQMKELENLEISGKLAGVGGTVASESAMRSAGTFLSQAQAPPPAPWPDGGPRSLRSACCGLAIYKNQTTPVFISYLGSVLQQSRAENWWHRR